MVKNAKSMTIGGVYFSVVFGIALVSLVFWIALVPSSPSQFILAPFKNSPKCHSSSDDEHKFEDQEDEPLESILARSSMANKTLIIAVVNKAYVEDDVYSSSATMLDTFLESFWLGNNTRHLLEHLLLVAADQTAYDRCRFLRLNCYKLETDGVDYGGEKLYMSEDFIKMMWRRTKLLLAVLQLGYNFVFTDTDVLWLRNPFINLDNDTNIDLQISCDKYNGDPSSDENPINAGFYFIRSSNRTIDLFYQWHSMKVNSTGEKEQDVLVDLIQDNIFSKLNVTRRYLDPLYFNGFCSPRRDLRVVTTVHANCCRSIRAKVADLTAALRDWQVYAKSVTLSKSDVNGTSTSTRVGNQIGWLDWSKPVNCENSWMR